MKNLFNASQVIVIFDNFICIKKIIINKEFFFLNYLYKLFINNNYYKCK